jgi:Stress responsive A/B Barrel Domain
MIQHVVLVNFRHGVPESMRQQCVVRLRELAWLVPGLTNWRVGLNMTTMMRAWDMSVTGEFATLDDVAAYRAHPAHQEAQRFVDGFAAETIGVDFDPAASITVGHEKI